jgi:broad specificity phosphatase PhoE
VNQKTTPGPAALWLVRHGQSSGNVARDAAEAAGLPMIDIAARDVDVPLSPLGEQQADALGRWFGRPEASERPTVVLTSPYLRARQTAERLVQSANLPASEFVLVVDERLREKEFGILDRLTKVGIQQRFPEQAEIRKHLGKFYHRPPGGESWTDVILRLRSVYDSVGREFDGERVLIVSHQVVVLCFRYVLERLTEEQILAIDRAGEIANCSVTHYDFVHDRDAKGRITPRRFNFVTPLEEADAPVTTRPDAPVARK